SPGSPWVPSRSANGSAASPGPSSRRSEDHSSVASGSRRAPRGRVPRRTGMTSIPRTAAALIAIAGLALAGCSAPSKNSSSSRPGAPQVATGGGATGGGAAGGGAAAPAPLAPQSDGIAASDDRQAFGTEVDPAVTAQSTFAMDVDTASYGYARNLIRQGQRPVPQDVRPEEFVNAFREDYDQPAANGFTVALDGAQLPGTHRMRGAADVRLLRVGLQTRAEESANRPDAALTFVIDVSGSMGEPGKLDMVKEALHTLVDQLRPTDSVAIVTFTDEARVVRPMTGVQRRAELNAAIDGLAAGGSTNLESGLVTGYKVARDGFRNGVTNRVVLLSDGLANVGDTAAAPILAQVREEADKQIALLGVGVGTDYGDQLM